MPGILACIYKMFLTNLSHLISFCHHIHGGIVTTVSYVLLVPIPNSILIFNAYNYFSDVLIECSIHWFIFVPMLMFLLIIRWWFWLVEMKVSFSVTPILCKCSIVNALLTAILKYLCFFLIYIWPKF